jgi:hypothetical protein
MEFFFSILSTFHFRMRNVKVFNDQYSFAHQPTFLNSQNYFLSVQMKTKENEKKLHQVISTAEDFPELKTKTDKCARISIEMFGLKVLFIRRTSLRMFSMVSHFHSSCASTKIFPFGFFGYEM